MKQSSKLFKFIGLLLVVGLLFAALPTGPAQAATVPEVVYDSLLSPLPGNVASQGFECCAASEFGDYVKLAGTNRGLSSVTTTMSTYAYQSTYPTYKDSTGYDHPITLNVYRVNPGTPNAVGAKIGSVTQTMHIPWRPEPTAACADNKWKDVDGVCYSGLAFNITFDFSAMNVTLPDEVILGVAFNTDHHGYAPINAVVPGPYDFLNVGAQASVIVGTEGNGDLVFLNSLLPVQYGDTGVTGVFRETLVGWGAYGHVPFQITAYKDPIAVDDTYVTPHDKTLTIIAPGVLKNDKDPDGDVMTATLVTNVSHGTLSLYGDGSFTYTPAPGFVGTDTFTYQLVTYPALAADNGWTDEALVTITVTPSPYIYYFPLIFK